MLQVTFYLGQNEDYNPGDSSSDSSEKLLQRDSGENRYKLDFGEGGIYAIKRICFCRRFLLVMRRSYHPKELYCFSRYEGTFQVAQGVKNPPAMQETQRRHGFNAGSGRSPGGEHSDPLQYSCLGNPMGRGAWRATNPRGHKELDMTEQLTKC